MQCQIGKINTLEVVREKEFGVYLEAGNLGQILLPKRYIPKGCKIGGQLDVFVYLDSEDQLIATTETPKVQVGQFAGLKAVAVNSVGAFFDWGLPKDLLVPFSKQKNTVSVGETHLLFVYLDVETNRIVATTKVDALLNREEPPYRTGDQVSLIIGDRTDIGFKCIVDQRFWGVLFFADVPDRVFKGQKLEGFIKRVREDGKIDLSLQQTGYQKVTDILDDIVAYLEKNGGSMAITDKSNPEDIKRAFGVSKATFKKALGALYKDKKVTLAPGSVSLAKKS
ncbi:GntR family transcriptional regulator [Maribrevibacterium harenarium]|uniref:GntR family transcriptional regulator n=1 Tax=Maribrevibacterium harenarium TaxID=2589817 RepID=A0A501X4X2_9GAMM|nr:S1-like domain-containing RNA-binding protein [Maribrevibacterium harenarium]TPE55565.1 GntR family transcriptional regulator [Maribrevibacterium harenarium]